MVTKYERHSDVHESMAARQTPWARQGPPQRPLSPRQRIFIVVMALIFVMLLGKLAYDLNQGAPYVYQPVLRGEGTIVETAPGTEGPDSARITVSIVDGGQTFEAGYAIPAPYGASLAEGDRVAVLYRVSETRQSIQLLECGLVALSGGNR